MNLHRSYLFGLGMHSDIPLLTQRVDECPVDVRVRWARNAKLAEFRAIRDVHPGPIDEIQLKWPKIGVMCVRHGNEIELRTDQDCDVDLLGHLVTGLGIGLILHQRGALTLHASAVQLDGVAFVFAGPKMAGKSTIAAALVARRHTLISDDVVAIDLPEQGAPQVRSGAPYLKLWPDSAASTGYDPAGLPRVWSSNSKRIVGFLSRAFPDPVPLGGVVVLNVTAEEGYPSLESLHGVAAFRELALNSHIFRWVQDRRSSALLLQQSRDLLKRITVYKLTRGKTMESLASMSRLIEDLAASLRGDQPAESSSLTASARS